MRARLLALVLAFEGAVVSLIGIAYGVTGLVEDPGKRPLDTVGGTAPTEIAAAAALLAGVVLLLLARATGRRKAWSQSPAIVLNVFPFPIGVGVLQAGVWWVGVPMMAVAGAVLYLYTTAEVRAALAGPS